jgi:hypothetical protein
MEELKRRIEALGIRNVHPILMDYEDLYHVCRKNDYNNRSKTSFANAAIDAEAVLGVQPVVFVIAYVGEEAYCYPSPSLFPRTRASHIALIVRPTGSEQEQRFNAWKALKVASEILRFEVPHAWLYYVLMGRYPEQRPAVERRSQQWPQTEAARRATAPEERRQIAYEIAKSIYGERVKMVDPEILVDLIFGIPIDKVLEAIGLPRQILTDRRFAQRVAELARDPVRVAIKILAEELNVSVEEVEQAVLKLKQ